MSKQEEEAYLDELAKRQEKEKERLVSYHLLRKWLVSQVNPLTGIPETLITILDLCADLATTEEGNQEYIIAEIEEELR